MKIEASPPPLSFFSGPTFHLELFSHFANLKCKNWEWLVLDTHGTE